MRNPLVLLGLLLAAVLVLTGCGGREPASSGSSGDHNKQDVTFARDMVPHHRQAVQMATMARSRAGSPEVKQLAEDIKAAQGPEIKTMTGWLEAWGEDVPSGSMGGMHGGMSGMMSGQDMDMLGNAAGDTFDRMWLEGMTAHHQGAVKMADTEITQGQDRDAIALARTIKAAQGKEIAKMKVLLRP